MVSDQKRGEESLRELLKERAKIDEFLQDKFSKEMTIMFTDIKGSTTYFESRGDINGLSMVYKHNELLFPIIEHHQGTIVKTIGDSIMASFPDAVGGVQAAIEMQRTLSTYNATHPKQDHIQIRIGLNAGRGIVENRDVFGDIVNVAARIESLAEPGQILVSQTVYEAVRQTDDIICRYFDCTKIKGREEDIELYQVIWGEEEITLSSKRSATQSVKQQGRERKVFYLDISREENKLKFIAFEKVGVEERTIRPYEEKVISISQVEEERKEIVSLLNKASNGGRITKEILSNLRSIGEVLYEEILTSGVKEELHRTKVQDLIINIDGSLVQIPWELLYDGKEFFCQRFNMGRIVKTRQRITSLGERSLGRPLKMLIICDPRGDLKDSYQEGMAIRDEMDKHLRLVNATLKNGKVKSRYLQEHIRYFDILHYAGHADYNPIDPSRSGWLLQDGKFTSTDITKMMEMKPLPALVFSNACHSGQTEEWSIVEGYEEKIFSLANAFLLAGVQHYVGSFWEILDEPSSRFALEFYRFMIKGLALGECVRKSRLELIKQYGEDTIVWASYMLYGDPSYSYLSIGKEEEDDERVEKDREDTVYTPLKEVAHRSIGLRKRKSLLRKVIPLGIGIFMLSALVLGMIMGRGKIGERGVKSNPYQLAYQRLREGRLEEARKSFNQMRPDDALHFEGLAAVYFKAGEYERSLLMCERALKANRENLYSHIIRGNIFLNQGKINEAALEYERATKLTQGTAWQRAEAYNRLGRLYAAQHRVKEALSLYSKAALYNPDSAETYSNQGRLFERTGNLSEAISLYKKALERKPQDPIAMVLLKEATQKRKLAEDREKSQRIDTLVAELIKTYQEKKEMASGTGEDKWTSKPLTLSFLNFQVKGIPSTRDGEDEYLLLKLTSQLQEKGSIHIVERALLDKLLEELKLSSSDLADPQLALKVGRIAAARLIATGSITRYGRDLQVSLRLIETETTAVKVTVIESAEREMSIDELSEKIAQRVIEKLNVHYPLRGRIISLKNEELIINIGTDQGVTSGITMKILEEVEPVQLQGKWIVPQGREIGKLEITSVEPDLAYARVFEKNGDIQVGFKVEEHIVHKEKGAVNSKKNRLSLEIYSHAP